MSSETPLVSVITPAYNAARFIGRTLGALRAQTFFDFEAIVVDDGSTDATADETLAAIAGDPRFRLIRQPNAGVAVARNRALSLARGRYVANLDADDLWAPTFLERTVAALEGAGEAATFAFARSLWIDSDDVQIGGEPPRLEAPVDYREILVRNPVGNGSAALMRRSAVAKAGGYDAGLVRDFGQTEDWQLLLELAAQGPVLVVEAPLVLYRIHATSSSHSLERSVAGALEVIRRQMRTGRAPRRDYWAARSLSLIWLARRAETQGHVRQALKLAAMAYVTNPLWITLPELRAPLLGPFRRLARYRARRALAAQPSRS